MGSLSDRFVVNSNIILLISLMIGHLSFCNANDNDVDDGGWYTDPETRAVDAGPCDIDVRDGPLSQEEFMENYAFKKPVVLRGITDNSEFQKLTRKEELTESHGSLMVKLSSANTHSYQKVQCSLKNYFDEVMTPQNLATFGNETFYWFGDHDYSVWNPLFNIYRPPPLSLPGLKGVYSFGAAGPGTGVPFHIHGPGFAEVIYGRKRWFMYPPADRPAFNPDKSTLHWVLNDYRRLPAYGKPLECTINKGEIIYFPDQWWHATLNIDNSVFISTFLG